jgi:hypothetical protein
MIHRLLLTKLTVSDDDKTTTPPLTNPSEAKRALRKTMRDVSILVVVGEVGSIIVALSLSPGVAPPPCARF